MSFFSLGMMKEKMIIVKTLTEQLLENNHPLHYSRNYATIRITLILIFQ